MKKREHVEGEPVGRGLVEGAEDAGIVGVAGAAIEQGFGFFAAVATEIAMEKIDHRPEVAAFFDVDLKNVAEIVERRAGEAEGFLLLDGGGLGVALRDDDAAERGAIFAGDFLPGGLAFVAAEIYEALFVARLKKNSPTIFGHADVAELGPAVGLDAGGGAEVDLEVGGFVGAHVGPPAEEGGLPVFESALEDAVATEVDVVGDFFGVVDHGDPRLENGNWKIEIGEVLRRCSKLVRRVPS